MEDIELLCDPRCDDRAEPTFRRVLERFGEARQRVDMHMFVWRNDEIGNAVGEAVLAAADRGVAVRIRKDLGAIMYERVEMNRQSLLPLKLTRLQQLWHRLCGLTFPDSFVDDSRPHRLGQALLDHPRVEVEWVAHTHSKYYVFDDACMITGSINLEDRHRGYLDYMLEITGRQHIDRFRQRLSGAAALDPTQSLEFVVNVREPTPRFEIKPLMLDLLAQSTRDVYIEMAYLGDPDLSDAIVAAARRGVAVSILFSRHANIGNDINYRVLHTTCQRAPTVRMIFADRMIHAKLLAADDHILLGSANMSVFSLQNAVEFNLLVHSQPGFAAELAAEIGRRKTAGAPAEAAELAGYNRLVAMLQQAHQLLS
jgi:cardiolipin synthase